MLNYKYLIILILSLNLIFLSSCSKLMKNKDEMFYGNSNTETTKPSVETIKYTIEENKVMTDDYSFELPKGYEVKGNENYISAGSNASGIDISVYSYTDNKITREEYVQNILDKTASWHREYTGVEWKANGFEVAMSDMFASRPLCTIFASQVIKEHGTWDATKGYNYIGLNAEDIACDLFAHYVGKKATAAINKVNACWGDGWIQNNQKSEVIKIRQGDPNALKYEKIWKAAPEIKAYAQKEGIFIIL